jgi:hypothetical protein
MVYLLPRSFLCLLLALSLAGSWLTAQQQIAGRIGLDTTRWAPVAYLSRIPDFTQLYSISNESIIMKSEPEYLLQDTLPTGRCSRSTRSPGFSIRSTFMVRP